MLNYLRNLFTKRKPLSEFIQSHTLETPKNQIPDDVSHTDVLHLQSNHTAPYAVYDKLPSVIKVNNLMHRIGYYEYNYQGTVIQIGMYRNEHNLTVSGLTVEEYLHYSV